MTQRSKIIKVNRVHPDAVIPTYAHDGDSGFDLVAIENVILEPGETVKVRTGLAFEIPLGYEMQIRPRSGLTSKTKLRVQLGTVDSGYRGEVSVIVDNVSSRTEYVYTKDDWSGTWYHDTPLEPRDGIDTRFSIEKGERIAQGVIVPVVHAVFAEVDVLSDTERGNGGFGSTDG